MRKKIALMHLSLGVALLTSVTSVAVFPLRRLYAQNHSVSCCQSERLGLDEQIWSKSGQLGDQQALLNSIDHSLRYLQTGDAVAAYQRYPVAGITRDRVIRSLERFRQLVLSSQSPEELETSVKREFMFYQSVGKDGKGNVLFTAYYEPIYPASRVQTAEYRYPIYRLPPDFTKWHHPNPTRAQLEGKDGLLGAKSPLRGLELAWMRHRLESFLVHIEGSARLLLTDGSEMTIGFAGKTDYPYTSVGRELAKDGKLPLKGMTLPIMSRYFNQHPYELSSYLPRVRGFVFFKETNGAPASTLR